MSTRAKAIINLIGQKAVIERMKENWTCVNANAMMIFDKGEPEGELIMQFSEKLVMTADVETLRAGIAMTLFMWATRELRDESEKKSKLN